MSKKRISSKQASILAKDRMVTLMELAGERAAAGDTERSRRYVQLAKRIGMRTNTTMLKDFLYCRECDVALVPGRNCRVRLRGQRITTRCLECGNIRRVPYLKERRLVHAEIKEKRAGEKRK